MPLSGVGLEGRQRSGGPAGVNGDWVSLRRHDQPEAIAAEAIHMGIDDGDGRRGCHHRFNGAAALAQDRQRALTGEVVGGHRHAVGRNVATVHKLSFLNESPAEHCKSCSISERFVSLIKTMTRIFPLARYV